LLCGLASLPPLATGPAGAEPAPSDAPECRGSEVFPALRFGVEAERQQIVITFRNGATQGCMLTPVEAIHFSGAGSQNAPPPMPAMKGLLLDPGESAALILDWPLESDDPAQSCRDVTRIELARRATGEAKGATSLLLETTNQPLRACQPARYQAYRKVNSPDGSAAPPVILRLSADEEAYYPDEDIGLQSLAEDPSHRLPAAIEACPKLSTMEGARSAEGAVLFNLLDLTPEEFGLRDGYLVRRRPDSGLYMAPDPAAARFPAQYDYEPKTSIAPMHSIAYVSACSSGWRTIAASDYLTVGRLDPPAEDRKWGPTVDGFALSLTIDRGTYRLGRDVPLNLACARLDQDWIATSPMREPICTFQIDVDDGAGHVTTGRAPTVIFGGGGRVTYNIEAGAALPSRGSLRDARLLPDHPGKYTISATWWPRDRSGASPDIAVHSAPVTFEVVDGKP